MRAHDTWRGAVRVYARPYPGGVRVIIYLAGHADPEELDDMAGMNIDGNTLISYETGQIIAQVIDVPRGAQPRPGADPGVILAWRVARALMGEEETN